MSRPCDETLAVLKQRYVEASRAYHDLQIGVSGRVFVDQNSERVEFTAANRQSLLAYLTGLQRQICQLAPNDPICNCGVGFGSISAPLGALF
ncbi:gpW family head-tail joining protein [Proteus mirabilis]|uniref:Head-to-tail joining protein n=3 Tax=Lavrentievavirus TaxID=2943011 RepID=A0A2H4PRF0_9CAUD|nr:head-tail adaptor Ad1 [Proteus phage pPM_01]YP_009998008.1 head-tail adaptor Ad1 [Proteus phage PM87]YP_009998105.1 head-tail adaptor Ad1 [Escherichia phage E21]YP_010187230.1 head-tail adaptor Ad1 [Proteus phage ASh-2020a]QHJ72785.1 putative head-to-tail joining protein [Proteus phage P16-2532]UGO36005.1 putative head-tail joining protein [Proteus phage vB_PmiS_Inception]UGO48757.1 putative head-to-tail joining protein [Proteus phage vB_PmiS_Jing313]UGO51488.1 putative head-to-tail joini